MKHNGQNLIDLITWCYYWVPALDRHVTNEDAMEFLAYCTLLKAFYQCLESLGCRGGTLSGSSSFGEGLGIDL